MKYSDHIHTGQGRWRMTDGRIALEFTHVSTPGLESLLLLVDDPAAPILFLVMDDAKQELAYMLASEATE